MKVHTIFILLCILWGMAFSSHPFPSNHLLLNYFKGRNVLSVTYYSCRSDSHKLTREFNKENVPVIVLTNTEVRPVLLTSKNGVIVDLSCDFVPDLLDFSLQNYLFREIISWIFIGEDGTTNYELLIESFIPISSEVVIFTPIFNDPTSSWNIFSIYKVTEKSEMNFTPILYTSEDNVVSLTSLYETTKRKNLNGSKIRATIAFHYPHRLTKYDDLRMNYIDTATKTTYQFLMNLATDLNFTYDLTQTDSYGFLKNGSFTGLMGHLERKEIEVGIASSFLRKDRLPIVEYISESFIIRSPLIFRQPSLASVSNIYALPFGLSVWVSLIALIVILILAQILLIAMPIMRNEASLLDSFSIVLSAVSQQGFSRDSFRFSWRILHFITFLSFYFLFSSYSANIVALLQSPSNALKTISDVTHSNLKVQVQNKEYNPVLYEESTDPAVIELFLKKIKPFGAKGYEDAEVGVKNILTGRFAYQIEAHTAYKIISNTYTESEKCGLKEIESVKIPRHSIPIVRNSSYRSIFRERLMWQRETGHFDVNIKRWVTQKT
uniref:Ionotropic glutamate receptor C-terminal domain-containing protein n=1 Tax=Lutzomyia longipalpis TaxID=7200 RepID=A0A1B0FV11_LUTLO